VNESLMAKTISQQLAEFVADLAYEKLPADAIAMAQLCLLDWLGSAIGGGDARPVRIIVDVVKDLGGRPEATVIADGSKSSCHLAALANAAASHVLEMDDLHKPSVLHPAAPVIPAALAMAERDALPGSAMLTAIVAGYEVAIRAGEALGPSHYTFWHTTATCGVFGAAAAAGKLLHLTPEQLTWALGNAGTQSAGLWEFLVEGAMSKQLHPAKGAADGLLAALLAQRGFTGATQIFEGEKGLARATSAAPDLARLADGLGTAPLRILENSFKAHAACYHIHSSIDAALALKARLPLNPTDITKVTVRLYGAALDLLEKVEPISPYAAKFSIPYCVATALLRGRVSLSDFEEAAMQDPAIRQLMSAVVLKRDPDLDRVYPDKWPAVVTLETRGGGRHEARVDVPKGDPENPMSHAELIAKFHTLAGRLLAEGSRSLLVERCLNLHKVENVRQLLKGMDLTTA
jgi:2-methylcitrate dehydratase PrpD